MCILFLLCVVANISLLAAPQRAATTTSSPLIVGGNFSEQANAISQPIVLDEAAKEA